MLQGSTPTSTVVSWERPYTRGARLSVIAKRSYELIDSGRLRPAAAQDPLAHVSGDASRTGCFEQDTDLWPSKPLTDVVIQGHLYPPTDVVRFTAKVHFGPVTKELLVTGDRKAMLARDGRIVFSEPRALDRVPLSYARAYGGIDLVAEERLGNPMRVFDKYRRPGFDPANHSPFIYPRNAAGRGYLVHATPQAVDALSLPNIEDPADPLTGERLVVGATPRWPLMPLPWGTNWLHPSSFPRCAYLGGVRPFAPFDGPWPEVRRGFAQPDFPRVGPAAAAFDPRCWNGGSLGLQMPLLRGDLSGIGVRLEGFLPRGEALQFRLPARPPRLAVDDRKGSLVELEAVLHHVVIRPDDRKVSLVWRGEAPALRRYLQEEVARMPYEVVWDG